MCRVCRGVVPVCCQLCFLLCGLTSMKLEKRIQKMYTFTYLRLFTFMLSQLNIKLWQHCEKLKFSSYPHLQDISNILQNFKFLHLRVDEIVGVLCQPSLV